LKKFSKYILLTVAAIALTAWLAGALMSPTANAQAKNELFRVGERLTYNISLGRFPNAAFAETYVVSRGKVAGKDAVEVQSKLRILDFIAVDFLLADTQRTALVSPIDGMPIYVKNVDTSTGAPIETVINFAEKGGGVFDLSSMIYKIRSSGGSGAFEFLENDKRYGVTFNTIGTEIVNYDAGDFATSIIDVQSNYLTEHGITSLKISIASDGSNIPVQFRAKTAKGEFRALISSIQVAVPDTTPTPTPVTPAQTPRPTPKPTETPSYVDNMPLVGMPFELGESLDYSVTSSGRNVGVVTISAKERKKVNGRDSLVLSAVVSNSISDFFRIGNGIRSNVSPDSLTPFDMEMRFDGPLSGFNQSLRFDHGVSKVSVGAGAPVDIPVGTHNILSLIFAARQFNLTPSKDASSPVNDTRVAVFWQGKKANVFMLRPSLPQTITVGDRKISAQRITVNTGDTQLDALNISVWLSNDGRRIPLRVNVGSYQLDLIPKNIEFRP